MTVDKKAPPSLDEEFWLFGYGCGSKLKPHPSMQGSYRAMALTHRFLTGV
jgi:hypothetical protein